MPDVPSRSTRHRPRRPEHPEDALARLIGARLKTRRGGERQEDIAARARQAGLPWVSTTVALLEQGRRRLTLGEALVLPSIYHCSFDEVLPREDIELWLKLRVHLARNLALSKWMDREEQIWVREVGHKPEYPKVIGEGNDGQPIIDPTPRRQPLPELIDLSSGGEAELDAADALKLHPHHVALRSWKLAQAGRWDYPSLTRERDHRMARAEQQDTELQDQTVSEADKAKRRRALRGHISRALLAEIESLRPGQDPTIAGIKRSRRRG